MDQIDVLVFGGFAAYVIVGAFVGGVVHGVLGLSGDSNGGLYAGLIWPVTIAFCLFLFVGVCVMRVAFLGHAFGSYLERRLDA